MTKILVRRRLLGPCVLFILLWSFSVTSFVYAGHDDALRLDLNYSSALSERFRLVNYVFIQANDHLSDYNYFELGTGLLYQTPISWLSFLVYYQLGLAKKDRDSWLGEQKPSLNMNAATRIFGFRVSNQIRYEYRMTPDWHDYRIKNTLDISRPDTFLKPSATWEMFYEHHDRAVTLNRIKFGVTKSLSDHVSFGPYYRLDFSKSDGRWDLRRQLFGFHMTFRY